MMIKTLLRMFGVCNDGESRNVLEETIILFLPLVMLSISFRICNEVFVTVQ